MLTRLLVKLIHCMQQLDYVPLNTFLKPEHKSNDLEKI